MSESNGDASRLDRLEQAMLTMLESQKANWDEHDRIWKAVDALREQHFEITTGIKDLTKSIRELIDRIPPEYLR